MPEGGSPMVRRRELGASLRRYRNEAGLTVKDVTDQLLCSAAKISRIETGHRNATLRDVRDFCDMYGITDLAIREHLMALARESRQRGWWQPYTALEPSTETFIGLEADAAGIYDYQASTVPGLLQTREYADAILHVWRPAFSAEEKKLAVDVRMERQRLLNQGNPPQFSAIIDEAALRRNVGGRAVMRAQLECIVELCERRRHVTIQVLPFDIGAHEGMGLPFIILDFTEPDVPSIVHIDGVIGEYLEQAADVERYRQVFDNLRKRALSPAASKLFIQDVSRDH